MKTAQYYLNWAGVWEGQCWRLFGEHFTPSVDYCHLHCANQLIPSIGSTILAVDMQQRNAQK
jgi:hypothetical protein